MFNKLATTFFCCLLFASDGCDTKPDNKPAAPAQTATPVAPSASVTPAPDAATMNACALIEESEIAALQGQKVTEAKASSREDDDFVMSQCFYMVAAYQHSVSLEVTERNPKNQNQDAIKKFWNERFVEAKVKKKAEKPMPVAGVGEAAYWVGNDRFGALYALKKDRLVRISVGGPEGVNAKIDKSKRLAEKALSRLG